MYLVKNTCHDPHFNLALDEYLLTRRKEEFFMLWQNEPSVIIGRNQNALAEINTAFLREKGIHLVRRMSGGGAVFHDLGNINFTYITPCAKQNFFKFERFATPVLSALQALGIEAQATGRNDLTIEGKKFSGNAQHLQGGRLLHHGTLLYDSDFSYMQGALNVDPAKLQGKGVTSVRARVTNLRSHNPRGEEMQTQDFLQYMEDYILRYFEDCTLYELSPEDLEQVNRLADEKYRREEWNLLFMGNYTYKSQARFPTGKVGLSFEVQKGVLTAVAFEGDFFGIRDIGELEQGLCGVAHTWDSVRDALAGLVAEDFISGVSADDLAGLFFS